MTNYFPLLDHLIFLKFDINNQSYACKKSKSAAYVTNTWYGPVMVILMYKLAIQLEKHEIQRRV